MLANKIPKKIHYCWFGKGKKNELIEYCMKSWGKILPDYEIKEWNEENFDITCNKYVKEAYEAKKWAFVSDYVRLYALYKEGGVYLDTDVELTSSIDEFLNYPVFMGFDSDARVPSALIASQKEHNFIKRLLEYYKNIGFIKDDGSFDYKTNIETITEICINEHGLKLDNSHQIIDNDVQVFPKEYFTLDNRVDKNYAIHHFNASWVPRDVIIKQLKTYKTYYFFMINWSEKLLGNCSNLKERVNCDNIAIYGLGYIGKLFLKQCIKEEIQINYIVDNGIVHNTYNKIKVLRNEQLKDKNIKLIIVTPIFDFDIIKKDLKKYSDAKIVSLEEIVC